MSSFTIEEIMGPKQMVYVFESKKSKVNVRVLIFYDLNTARINSYEYGTNRFLSTRSVSILDALARIESLGKMK